MADATIKVDLKAYKQGFDDAMKQSQKETDKLKARLEKTGGAAKGFGGILEGITAGAIGGFVAGLVSIDTARAAFEKGIQSTQASADAFDKVMAGLTSGVDEFFASLTSGDWGHFFSNIDSAISRASELSVALDTLGDMEWARNFQQIKIETGIEKAKQVINSDTSSTEEKKKANEEIQKLVSEGKAEAYRYSEKAKQAAYLSFAKSAPQAKATEEDFFKYVEMQSRDEGSALEQYKKRKEAIISANSRTEMTAAGPGIMSMPVTTITDAGRRELEKFYDAEMERLILIDNNITDQEREAAKEIWLKGANAEREAERWSSRTIRMDNRANRPVSGGGRMTYRPQPKPEAEPKMELSEEMKNFRLELSKPVVTPIRPALLDAPRIIKELEQKRNALAMQLSNTSDPDARVKLKAEIADTEEDIEETKSIAGTPKGTKWKKDEDEEGGSIDGILENNAAVIDSLGEVAKAFDALTGSTDNAFASMLQWGIGVAQAVAKAIPSITALTAASKSKANAQAAEAATGAAASTSSIPIVGAIMAVGAVASVIAALANIPKFATGGIVPGTSFGGDKVLARLNSGEMILNQTQQTRLFSALQSGDRLGGGGGQVEFKIRGEELVGVINKYGRRSSRT